MTKGVSELDALRQENARLRGLLKSHGIPIEEISKRPAASDEMRVSGSTLSVEEKLALFQRLFRGREDVFAVRWEGTAGRAGYAPACGNEWRPGICNKPKIKCTQCQHQAFLSLDNKAVFEHLSGAKTIGVYALLPGDVCWFLAVDFDGADWRQDISAFRNSCNSIGLPVAIEVSRSGAGGHAWIFFDEAIPASDARRLGSAIISYTCSRTGQLSLSSYDRLFPNQDTMPKGGFGNLIALPLQKAPRERGCSVFVDERLAPLDDQWSYLSRVQAMSRQAVEDAILAACPGGHALDVAFVEEEDCAEPWKKPSRAYGDIPGSLPDRVHITQANQLYFDKAGLPPALLNRLVRLAAFQNPEFYKAQALRRSVWNKPRIIGRAENFPKHIALPRGCLDAVQELLNENRITWSLTDERFVGDEIHVAFSGELRTVQTLAVRALLKHESGVLVAPTAFGKTVVGAAIIAKRKVNTLVLVHRNELVKQWRERLQSLLELPEGGVGVIGGGKRKPTGKIDVAVMQSICRNAAVDELVRTYGQIIVDECHHVSAQSFESILREAPAKYVLGLTATPIRRDGQQAVLFMQCGPIRHRVAPQSVQPSNCGVAVRNFNAKSQLVADVPVQELFRELTVDPNRNESIMDDVRHAYLTGRHVLLLSERADHVIALADALKAEVPNLFCLHGRMGRKRRAEQVDALERLEANSPRVLVATGKLIGEGFDHPPLDTLVLAHPISWKGTLQQYAGRLHRNADSKKDVRICDYVDSHPITQRMWKRRAAGYRAMGYRIENRDSSVEQLRLNA